MGFVIGVGASGAVVCVVGVGGGAVVGVIGIGGGTIMLCTVVVVMMPAAAGGGVELMGAFDI